MEFFQHAEVAHLSRSRITDRSTQDRRRENNAAYLHSMWGTPKRFIVAWLKDRQIHDLADIRHLWPGDPSDLSMNSYYRAYACAQRDLWAHMAENESREREGSE